MDSRIRCCGGKKIETWLCKIDFCGVCCGTSTFSFVVFKNWVFINKVFSGITNCEI